MNDLSALMRALSSRDGDDDATSILPEAAIMEMRQRAKFFQEPCPFKVGDLVTPRNGGTIRGAGEPHLVVEVFEEPHRHWEEAGSNSEGALMTMRVMARSDNGWYPLYSVEHGAFERYTGAGS